MCIGGGGARGAPERIYIPEHNKPYDYNAFLAFIIPEHNKPYYYNVFLFFMVPE